MRITHTWKVECSLEKDGGQLHWASWLRQTIQLLSHLRHKPSWRPVISLEALPDRLTKQTRLQWQCWGPQYTHTPLHPSFHPACLRLLWFPARRPMSAISPLKRFHHPQLSALSALSHTVTVTSQIERASKEGFPPQVDKWTGTGQSQGHTGAERWAGEHTTFPTSCVKDYNSEWHQVINARWEGRI